MKPTSELARELVAHLEAVVDIAYAAGRKAGMEETVPKVLTIGHLRSISTRTHNVLLSAGLIQVDDIMLKSANDILRLPNMSSKGVGELAAALGDLGVKWPGKAPIRAAMEADK